MTQEEKQLLLKDLCARLPYEVNIQYNIQYNIGHIIETRKLGLGSLHDFMFNNVDIEPYLRTMSSMTDEEREEFRSLGGVMSYSPQHDHWAISALSPDAYDWLNKNKFDYRGLIPMGIALEAHEGMYN